MNMKHPAVISLGAFLAVWGTTSNFALDYRSILGAVVAGVFGYASSYRDWETDRKSTRLNSSHRL